ncbi:uncharacterized protein CPUR_05382 [Claviceps purpurea 20.1]|uniref:Retrotransposon gag domain-containing protein n=1 Tax=Claviceps purpurea (strain 20.1) TaxID=1111077 RepID=M1WG79_CLAP2|nr:uncharacterized protein CPUR_05382 [Claviceps purpurea 20.1]
MLPFLNNYSATKPAGSRLPKWIFVYDGLADQIQKQLPYYFESGVALERNAVAFLNHLEAVKLAQLELRRLRQASDESFSDYLVRFEAQMARAHRLDAPEDEKVELLHHSISNELDELDTRWGYDADADLETVVTPKGPSKTLSSSHPFSRPASTSCYSRRSLSSPQPSYSSSSV